MATKRYDNNVILVYGDLHFPFHDKRAFDFLAQLKDEYQPDRVVDLGDTADAYSFSRYPKSPSAMSASEEIKKLRKCVGTLASIFPRVEVMKSNHTDRLYSKATISGIPRELIVSYKELLGAPEGWKFHKDLTLTVDKTREKIYFCHERGSDVYRLAKSMGMSAVMGHQHNSFGLQYFSNPIKTMFAAQCGSLISDKGYAFAYNKANLFRPMKGAIIIVDGVPELKRLV